MAWGGGALRGCQSNCYHKSNVPWLPNQQSLGFKQKPKPQRILFPEAELRQEAKKPTDHNVKEEAGKGKKVKNQDVHLGPALRPKGKLMGDKLPFLTRAKYFLTHHHYICLTRISCCLPTSHEFPDLSQ